MINTKRKILIAGCARSGTTLTSELLGNHSAVFISPETKYFQKIHSSRHLLRLVKGNIKWLKLSYQIFLNSEYSTSKKRIFTKISFPEWKDIHQSSQNSYQCFFNILRRLSDKTIVGEKTPFHLFFLQRASKDDTNTHIVLIRRNALPNIASLYKRKGFRNVGSLTSCMARYHIFNNEIQKIIDRNPKATVISFEDIILDTEREMRKLCAFINVSYEDSMSTPRGQDSSQSKSSKPIIDAEVNNRFGTNLSKKQVDIIEDLFKNSYTISSNILSTKYPFRLILVYIKQIMIKTGVHLMKSGFYPFVWKEIRKSV